MAEQTQREKNLELVATLRQWAAEDAARWEAMTEEERAADTAAMQEMRDEMEHGRGHHHLKPSATCQWCVGSDSLLLAAADALAAWLHREDKDKQLQPLIGHCRRVAATLREQGWPAIVQAAGSLHDSVEHGYGFPFDLFPPRVFTLVHAVTRDKGEHYADYITRLIVLSSPEARAIKLADLRDNLDPLRPIPESLRKRYLKAVERLEAVE